MIRYAVVDTATSEQVGVFNSKSIAQARLAFKAHIRHAELHGAQPVHELYNRYTIKEINTDRRVLN